MGIRGRAACATEDIVSPHIGRNPPFAYSHYGTKKRADGRVIWKRDPAIANGFVPTELWRFVRQIKPPIIYILGGRSTVVPAATQEELKKALPQVEIVTVPGAGHYPSEENPAEFLAIADKFLSR